MKQYVNGLTILGIVTFFVFSSHLLETLVENPDIWWDAKGFYHSVDEANDRVRLFIAGRSIEQRLREGSLSYSSIDGEWMPVTGDDVRLRLNNWDRQRARNYRVGMIEASLATAGIMLVILGFFVQPKDTGKRERDNGEEPEKPGGE